MATRTTSSSLVELLIKEIADVKAQGETLKLSSFRILTVRNKGLRVGRNPKTGVGVPILPRRVVHFKASAIMKQKIKSAKLGTQTEAIEPDFRTIAAE